MRLNNIVRLVGFAIISLCALAALPEQANSKSARLSKNAIVQNRNERDRLYARIKELNASKKRLDVQLNDLDTQLDDLEAQEKSCRTELEAKDKERKLKTDELAKKQEQLDGLKGKLEERAVNIYMQPDFSYVDVLFGAFFPASTGESQRQSSSGERKPARLSFTDVVERVYFIQAILKHDQDLIEDVQTTQQKLNTELMQLSQQISAIDQIKSKLNDQMLMIEENKQDKQLVLTAIAQDKALALRQINELEEENKKIAQYLKSVGRSASGYKGKAWSGSFKKPCAGTITSGFGYRVHPILHIRKMHTGVDISAAKGTTILAAGDGKVVSAGWRGGYGNCVIVDHGAGRSTLYGHMSKITCSAGDIVSTHTKLGEVGSTGFSTGPHCHFEVRINGDPVDPLQSL